MIRYILFLMTMVFAMACTESRKEHSSEMTFYTGTYTGGESQGIYKYVLSQDGTLEMVGLMAATENPSFLALSADGHYLLAVNEISNEDRTGYVSSFKIERDTLLFIDQKPSGGAHPCHVVTNPEGYVVVANYSGGNMGLLKLQADGHLSDLLDVQQHRGSGSHPRQEGPHAHSGWFTGEGGVISVDLGTNQLWFSQIDERQHKFVPEEPNTFTLDQRAGPRHLAFHPKNTNWIYVVNELTSSVSLLIKDPESSTYSTGQTISTLPEEFSAQNTCADIRISADGKFLYASNRGHNSIALFSVDPNSGTMQVLGQESVRGETPRNFSLSPDGKFILVANQTSNNLVSFRRNRHTGMLTFLNQIQAPSPVCILFNP